MSGILFFIFASCHPLNVLQVVLMYIILMELVYASILAHGRYGDVTHHMVLYMYFGYAFRSCGILMDRFSLQTEVP